MTQKMYASGVVELDDMEIVNYGLEHLVMNVLGLFLTLFVGVLFGKLPDALIMWLAMFPLRKNAGGFHAETRTRCFLVSIGIIFGSFYMLYATHYLDNKLWIVEIVSWIIIFFLAPVECKNKRLEESEKREYRSRTRTLLIVEAILLGIACIFSWNAFRCGIAMCWSVVAVALLAGTFKLLIPNNKNK